MSARERILDAAATVLRSQGIAAATTREIARAAGCSEALLYKNFADKQDLFLAVLAERIPRLASTGDLAGGRTVAENLTTLVEQLLGFYVRTFPVAASIFGTPELLAAHRAAMDRRGAGPEAPARHLQAYLDSEITNGRLPEDLDARSTARVLAGAALLEAFLAAYAGADDVPDATARARDIVAVVTPLLD
ncbi:TetR/AcrR family transcriptional regulator [Cellulosimicrobium cellulans]|uniref:TetR/AcrR family transcriptional regulator n=1 Tax=Cellulosimicrobium cellulans TaxID=1710 RepID=UPI001963D89A|nr:TetR/AcrR family transcriptional regulator [Cellulosimicrobium cellulans]MBN0040507.1 TetR/AcrR family transcriptional regulator [Cellulosimicrobium cellulans]